MTSVLISACRTPYAIKEGQSLPRIMETLTVAVEFINLPTLANQLPALEELRKETLRLAVSMLGTPCLIICVYQCHATMQARLRHHCAAAFTSSTYKCCRTYPDLRDKKPFWQRKPGCVKAGMLLLAHMERAPTHATLVKDRRFVLNRSAALLAEMVNLAALPRPPLGYGWLAPMVGSIEFLQHLIQVRACCSVSLSSRMARYMQSAICQCRL
jgi:translocation protein SEC63